MNQMMLASVQGFVVGLLVGLIVGSSFVAAQYNDLWMAPTGDPFVDQMNTFQNQQKILDEIRRNPCP